jgi:pimeloyl-ACP methyl ester carboxylesterase
VIVSVHGISLNAAEHMVRMRTAADKVGAVIIAPWFDRVHFRGYQRLLCQDGQTRADLALIAMLEDAAATLGVEVERCYLSGFSGGGQFAHRFAAFHADRVAGCVTSAAGWYTFPDFERPYPQGLAPGSGPAGLELHPAARQVPMHVLVGSLDDRPEPSLNMSKIIVAQQGSGRVTRARRWVEAMQLDRIRHGGAPVTITVLENLGHDFSKAVDCNALDTLIVARFGLQATKEKNLA